MPRLVVATSLLTALSSLAALTESASIASADRMPSPPTAEAQRLAPSRPDMPDPTNAEPPIQSGEPLPSSHFARPPSAGPHAMRRQPVLDRETIRAQLIENRAENLARFRAYQQAGVFPSNVYHQGMLNVWRDQDGHLCAAATIIKASGADELVDRVADQTNFIRLSDVKQGPLMDWILTSGFTQDEIAAIQKPYNPVTVKVVPAPAPDQKIAIDRNLRRVETARLAKLYKQVDTALVKNEKHSLDLAVDRLMKRQDLAWQLVN